MSSKKKIAAIVITTVALTASTVGIASASSKSSSTRVSITNPGALGNKGPRGLDLTATLAALVADETKRIDAAVAAGKLTAAQATILKAGLVAHVTDEVNAVRPQGPKGPMGDKGKKDDKGMKGGKGGKGGHGPMGTAPMIPAPTASPAASA
jgi:hypothetical protein